MVNFTHNYYKLVHDIFPTVRSVNYTVKQEIRAGCAEDIIVEKVCKGQVMLIHEEHMSISRMSLAFLQFDGNHPLGKIYSRLDYVELLNSFLPKGWGRNTMETVKAILWWKWIRRV